MPTFQTRPRFTTDLQHLTPAQRGRFRRIVVDAFVLDLRTGLFRPVALSSSSDVTCRRVWEAPRNTVG